MAFVLDLSERKRADETQKRAEAELQQARNAFAHRQRVSMLGELTASLAHEIRQPIAAARIDARVCMRALAEGRLDVESAREAAARLVNAATRADGIIKRAGRHRHGAHDHPFDRGIAWRAVVGDRNSGAGATFFFTLLADAAESREQCVPSAS